MSSSGSHSPSSHRRGQRLKRSARPVATTRVLLQAVPGECRRRRRLVPDGHDAVVQRRHENCVAIPRTTARGPEANPECNADPTRHAGHLARTGWGAWLTEVLERASCEGGERQDFAPKRGRNELGTMYRAALPASHRGSPCFYLPTKFRP
jgi:hypothetical protein